MDRKSEHLSAEGGDRPGTFGSDGAQQGQEAFGGGEGFVGRGIEPGKSAGIGFTPGVEGQNGGGEIDALYLWDFKGFKKAIFSEVPEADAASWGGAAGPAGALGGRGAADALKFKAVEAAARVVRGDAGKARIDDGGDALDGEGGFGDVRGADDFAQAGRGRLQSKALFVGSESAMERQKQEAAVGGEGLKALDGAADLFSAREKDQQVASGGRWFRGKAGRGGRREGVEDGSSGAVGQGIFTRGLAGGVGDGDGEGTSGDAEDGGIVEVGGDRLGIEGGGHDKDHQVVANGGLDFLEQGEGQIGVEAAFVEFIEQDRANAFEKWIGNKLAGENALSDDAEAGCGADFFLEANLIADLLAELPAVFIGDALGGGTGGDAARLKHHQGGVLGGKTAGTKQGGGNAGGFASTRFGNQNEAARGGESGADVGQMSIDGQRLHGRRDPWAAREGEDQPSFHCRMKGLPLRSLPMVVSGPWPERTTVSSGSCMMRRREVLSRAGSPSSRS